MAGHSKFKNIMFRKGAQDKKRAKIFAKLGREIQIASKIGGSDPNSNHRLRTAIDAAKAADLEPTETEDQVRFPKRPFVRSGYIVLEKKSTKTSIMNKISE